MLLEPCSHIQWEYSYQDSKLGVIETREQRQNFISNLSYVMKSGVLRNMTDQERTQQVQAGTNKISKTAKKDTMYCVGSIQDIVKAQ
jgi:hypothetical protein